MNNESAPFWIGLLMGVVATILVNSVLVSKEKAECEKSLPRDVECVWAPPAGYLKEARDE